jgi:ubiquinone/menaquinone biosynthesis C-methylase UbiE
MPIDFHDQTQRFTYTKRTADETWTQWIQQHFNLHGKRVLDLGCGGGIYTRALATLGASEVTGMDFSAEMLQGAAHSTDLTNICFLQGNATDTGLPTNSVDFILERAVIHHLDDLYVAFEEAYRILAPGGAILLQDRTAADCLLPGSVEHPRGYFFEKFPALATKELARRPVSGDVLHSLERAGFSGIQETQLWETRRIYNNWSEFADDLLARTGRSILHELTDTELQDLIQFIESICAPTANSPIIEKDRWTLWSAIKQ